MIDLSAEEFQLQLRVAFQLPEEIDLDRDLLDIVDADSLRMIECIVALEDLVGRRFNDRMLLDARCASDYYRAYRAGGRDDSENDGV
jgi:acyl carrier protein